MLALSTSWTLLLAPPAFASSAAQDSATQNAAAAGATFIPPAAWPSAVLNDRQAFVEQMLAAMTPSEKVGQMRLVSIGGDLPRESMLQALAQGRVGGTFNSVTRAENRGLQQASVEQSRLGIPIFFAYDVVHGHRTIFPIGPGLASTWNLELIEEAAAVMAAEAAADALDMTFAPVVDISRDPRWGRTSEGFGEDPYLVSAIARSMVHGFQGEDPADPQRIMASVKHFALYGAVEGGRDYNVVDMSPLRMQQDFLPPYRAALEAGAGAVMVALNTINGVPASANSWLMRELLRQDWQFDGLVLSDHGGITELLQHGVAVDGREAARKALEAGLEMSMADSLYEEHLESLVQQYPQLQAMLDDAVRHVLLAKYDMGLFHDPYRRIGQAAGDPEDVRADELLNRDLARRVAQQSLVLLENKNQTLPLAREAKVALVGPLADAPIDMLGSWSAAGNSAQVLTLYEGMRAVAGADAKDTVRMARGANITDDAAIVEYLNFLNWDTPEVVQDPRDPAEMLAEAVTLAQASDVIVAAVGEARGMSHESSSRTSLALPASQQRLLEALAATGKPLVVVLFNGRPLDLNWVQKHAAAVIEAWYPGTEAGHAVADVLYGDANPSGKLPLSFPRSVGHIPAHYNTLRLGRPYNPGSPGNYTSQYFDAENGPLYPFGYGLSYTDFTVSPPRLSLEQLHPGESATLTVSVTNTGSRAGATVVQLYVRDEAASVVRPVHELKGFQRLELAAGATQEVSFTVSEQELAMVNEQLDWVVEPGEFTLQVGLDSQNLQSVTLRWDGTAPHPLALAH